jgi:hypothetical protein
MHCPTCTCGTVTAYRYQPTRESVDVLRIANHGQARPTDSGRGIRLYAVRFTDGSLGQASAGELQELGPDSWRSFKAPAHLV